MELAPTPVPPGLTATRALGQRLVGLGYLPHKVAQALGIIAWNGRDMDGPYWQRPCHAEGDHGARVELLLRGSHLPRARFDAVLGADALDTGLFEVEGGGPGGDRVRALGTVLPLWQDLILTDRGDRSFVDEDGLFLPDSTTLAVRRALPPERVHRHLDLGSGAGAVLALAARRADETVGVDLNPRAGPATLRTAALSGLGGVSAFTGDAAAARALGRFDRVSFVLPTLVPWAHQGHTSIHTVAAERSLLSELIGLLPGLMAPGAVAVLYTQRWLGGQALDRVLDLAMGDRPWRALFWRDFEGDTAVGRLPSGLLVIEADTAGQLTDAPLDAPDLGCDDWWPLVRQALR